MIYSNKKGKINWIDKWSDWSERFIPDAFSLVLILTVVVAITALIFTDSTIVNLAINWYDGFWSMLAFTIQVCLLMFTGYLVSDAKPVRKLLTKLAKIPKTSMQAITIFLVFEIILYYLHFALGIAGAIVMGKSLLIEQRKKGNILSREVIVAIGTFCLVFQAGPTGGAPLLMASPGHFMEDVIGVIPLTESTLSLPMIMMNLTIALVYIIVFPIIASKIKIKSEDIIELKLDTNQILVKTEVENTKKFSEIVDNMPYFQIIIGIVGISILVIKLVNDGMKVLDLNAINFLLLMIALILHKSPKNITRSIPAAISTASGVMLQFPFYAGIFGMISLSGLGIVFSDLFVSLASQRLFTWVVFVFSALINMLVPSGGSQFMVEAPYIMPAAIEMGVKTSYVLNAFTIGDLSTNLIQPFWAIPILSAFNLKFKNIFAFNLIAFIIASIIISLYFFLWMF